MYLDQVSQHEEGLPCGDEADSKNCHLEVYKNSYFEGEEIFDKGLSKGPMKGLPTRGISP